MAQWVKNSTAVTQVTEEADSIFGMERWVKGAGIATTVAQVTAVAQIQSLAQEVPYATGTLSLSNIPLCIGTTS